MSGPGPWQKPEAEEFIGPRVKLLLLSCYVAMLPSRLLRIYIYIIDLGSFQPRSEELPFVVGSSKQSGVELS